jgi:hypothetical protein
MKDLALVNFRVFRQDRSIDAEEPGITCMQLFERKVAAVNRPIDPENLNDITDHLPCLRQRMPLLLHAKSGNLHVKVGKSRHYRDAARRSSIMPAYAPSACPHAPDHLHAGRA